MPQIGKVDIWSRPTLKFRSQADAVAALHDEAGLFVPFFVHAGSVLRLLEANGAGMDLELPYKVIEAATLNVVIFGETGSGKSTLAKVLRDSGDPGSISATEVGTQREERYPLPCGLVLVDTPGFRIPLPRDDKDNKLGFFSWLRELMQWQSTLRGLEDRCASCEPSERPIAALYCHRVGSRVLTERVVDLLRIPFQKGVRVFCVLTDVCSVDDGELIEVRELWKSIAEQLGVNSVGHTIEIVECNLVQKHVMGRNFEPLGLAELISRLVGNMEPTDIVNFASPVGWFRYPGKKRKREVD